MLLTRIKRIAMFLPFLCVLYMVVFSGTASAASAQQVPVTTVTVHTSSPTFVNQMAIGATHAQQDADTWNNAAAVTSAKQLM